MMGNIMSDYLKEQQNKFENYAEIYRREANEVFRELTQQLILVATVFISVLAIIWGNENFITKIHTFGKYILMGVFIFLSASLIFGIIQFFSDHRYFKEWSRVKFSIVEEIVAGKINENNILGKTAEKQKNIPNESNTVFVRLQVVFLFLAIFLLVIFMFCI